MNTSSDDMREAFRAHLDTSALVPARSRVLVGYSGGADSTCLLHLLHSLGIDVVAGHLHHGMRVEADDEQARCEAFCKVLDVPFATGRADVPKLSVDLKIGLEEAGRDARYRFFADVAFRFSCSRIATAHTRDDRVETVLLNIARGCGLSGLSGIPEVRGNIIRPLLPFTRAETVAYCIVNSLWTHEDPANSDPAFARSRIRARVVPEFRALNPKFDEAVIRLGEIAEDEDRFLDGAAAAALEQSELPLNGNLNFLTEDCEVAFSVEKLVSLPAVLLKRAIRLVASALGAELDYALIQSTTIGLASANKGSVTAEGGQVVLSWDVQSLHAKRLEAVQAFRHPLTIPGETFVDGLGWRFVAFRTTPTEYHRPPKSLEVVIDFGEAKGPLHFRSVEAGDSIQPLGMSGSRKLSDLLSEAKLTAIARSRLPIVCDQNGPLWVPGVVVSNRVRITESTRDALLIRFEESKTSCEP